MEARTVSGPKPHRFPALMSVSTASGLVRGREGAGRLEVPAPASGRRKDTCPEGSTRAVGSMLLEEAEKAQRRWGHEQVADGDRMTNPSE